MYSTQMILLPEKDLSLMVRQSITHLKGLKWPKVLKDLEEENSPMHMDSKNTSQFKAD